MGSPPDETGCVRKARQIGHVLRFSRQCLSCFSGAGMEVILGKLLTRLIENRLEPRPLKKPGQLLALASVISGTGSVQAAASLGVKVMETGASAL